MKNSSGPKRARVVKTICYLAFGSPVRQPGCQGTNRDRWQNWQQNSSPAVSQVLGPKTQSGFQLLSPCLGRWWIRLGRELQT